MLLKLTWLQSLQFLGVFDVAMVSHVLSNLVQHILSPLRLSLTKFTVLSG